MKSERARAVIIHDSLWESVYYCFRKGTVGKRGGWNQENRILFLSQSNLKDTPPPPTPTKPKSHHGKSRCAILQSCNPTHPQRLPACPMHTTTYHSVIVTVLLHSWFSMCVNKKSCCDDVVFFFLFTRQRHCAASRRNPPLHACRSVVQHRAAPTLPSLLPAFPAHSSVPVSCTTFRSKNTLFFLCSAHISIT